MINRLRASITAKLFFIICFLLLMTILPLFLTVNSTLTQLGDYVYGVNLRQFKTVSAASLSDLAKEQAQKYDSIFNRIKASAAFLAQKASDIYINMDLYSQNPVETIFLELRIANQIFYSPRSHPVITAYWGGKKISPEIEKEIRALSHISTYLKKSQELNRESIGTHIITATGIGRYYTTEPMIRNQCYNLPSPGGFDLRRGEPIRVFLEQETSDYQVQLTKPYMDGVIDQFIITATAPIIDGSGIFRGVTGINIPLVSIETDQIGHVDPQEKTDKEGIFFKFLMDRNGRIISHPNSHLELFNLKINTTRLNSSRDITGLNFTDIKSPIAKKSIPHILNSHSSLTRLSIDGDDYAFAAHRLLETGWHLVLVSREKDLFTSVIQTRKAMEISMSGISNYYKAHSAIIVFMAILIIFCAVKVIVHPIKRLTLFAERLSEGDRSMASPLDRKDEIGVLENRFDQMLKKLTLSEEKDKNYADSLENTITQRTKELQASNLDLIRAKEELESTVAKRTRQLKLLNEHLVYSEEMERKAIAADLHDTIAQTLAMSISKIKTMQEPGAAVNSDELSGIQNYLEQTTRGIRSLIYKLSPPILDDFDIDIAIGLLVEENNTLNDAEFTYFNNMENPVGLKKALKIMLYRATSELITNIFKYAGTKKAEIEISSTDTHIRIRVEDKGVGMDAGKTMAAEKFGFGLYYISQRMEHFNGQLIINSNPGQGTQIMLITPIIKEV